MTPPRPRIDVLVPEALANQPLVAVVAVLAEVEAAEAYELLDRGAVWLDRFRTKQPDLVVAADARLVIHFPPSGAYDSINITPADILYEDAALLALNKRPGWHANYTPWDMRGTLPYALAQYLAARDGQPATIHFAHQLDRDTSGVLLISKEPLINPALQRLFLTGGMDKMYLAVASGMIEQPTIEVETGHGRGRHGLFRVYPTDMIGQVLPLGAGRVRRMQTRFEVVARRQQATLIRALPLTGRTHQIRLHLAHVGHPLVGDRRYGGPAGIAGIFAPHHLLHARRLAFVHPTTQQPLELIAPLPDTWGPMLEVLGWHGWE